MSIDQLIELAQAYLMMADRAAGSDSGMVKDNTITMWAAISHAAASTAQAKMLAQMTDPGTRTDGQEIRVLMVDTGA